MIEKLITWLVWIQTKRTKTLHCHWTGKDGYWIAYGKIEDIPIKGDAHEVQR